jgi:hypothetical protein
MKYYIEYYPGKEPTLGSYWSSKYECVEKLSECDVFINNYHQGYRQVERLYQAARLGKRIINIGSASSDWTKGHKKQFRYALEKKALRDANDALFYEGINTTILNLGYIDTYRSRNKDVPKMSIEYVESLILWVLDQPHRIKEITVTS